MISNQKVILITCNWNAYSGLETAGVEKLDFPANVFPSKVTCLGQIDPGIILKAFESGADGVLMLGCPPYECNYEFGNRLVEDVYTQARELIKVLGYRDSQLGLDWVAAGQGEDFVEKVQHFVKGLNDKRSHS